MNLSWKRWKIPEKNIDKDEKYMKRTMSSSFLPYRTDPEQQLLTLSHAMWRSDQRCRTMAAEKPGTGPSVSKKMQRRRMAWISFMQDPILVNFIQGPVLTSFMQDPISVNFIQGPMLTSFIRDLMLLQSTPALTAPPITKT